MADTSRDQVLTNFMECTNIDDFDTAMQILERHNWNLLVAIQSLNSDNGAQHENSHSASASSHSTRETSHTSKQNGPSTIPKPAKRQEVPSQDDDDDLQIIATKPSSRATAAATSRTGARNLRFTIQYKDREDLVTISDSETVLQLRQKIAEKFRVPPTKQNFTNWMTKRYDDRAVLKDLNLPRDNTIHLIATASSIVTAPSSSSHASSGATSQSRRAAPSPARSTDLHITVQVEEKPGRTVPYDLHLESKKTVGELKREMEKLSHIPVAQQNWTGLGTAKDTDALRETSLRSKAVLSLRRKEVSPTAVTRKDVRPPAVVREPSESDSMDIDDDMPHILSPTTVPNYGASNRELLIPENYPDETTALENFVRVFHLRYHSTGPILYIGGLEEAIQAAFHGPVEERRPLAIYIHLDRSIFVNVFCGQVMADEGIMEYFAQHYIVWAWDFTSEPNQRRFVETFRRCVNPQAAQRLALTRRDVFPLIVILQRSRGSIDIMQIIEGQQTKDEVFATLLQCTDEFNEQRQRDAAEERQREERENLKKFQEEEYHRSMQADLAKEEARKREEFKQKEETRKAELLEKKRATEKQQSEARLPEEPKENEPNIITFKIRLPENQGVLMRRFRTSDQLQILFDFLSSQNQMFGEYRLLTTYPKRDLTNVNPKYTFESLKLYPQEQLILENI